MKHIRQQIPYETGLSHIVLSVFTNRWESYSNGEIDDNRQGSDQPYTTF